LTCGTTVPIGTTLAAICPATMSATDGPTPLYGTCVSGMPAVCDTRMP
jgi:hypothetical protein